MDGSHLLVYNFFFSDGKVDSLRVLPPPKELDTDSKGRLVLKSYYRWERMVKKTILQEELAAPIHLFANPTASSAIEPGKWTCGSRSGYEVFCFQKPSESFIFEGLLTVEGMGKMGLVSDIDDDGNGYFIAFDVSNGLIQIRAWGFNPLNNRQNFIFNTIQSAVFTINEDRSFYFKLIRYGSYIELSVDTVVKLTLMDYTYSGKGIGFYSASSVLSLQDVTVKILPDPEEEYASQEEEQKLPGKDEKHYSV
jgi:beta-fructofuranosidase